MARHGAPLYRANAEDAGGEMWTYLSVGPFESEARYLEWLAQAQAGDDPRSTPSWMAPAGSPGAGLLPAHRPRERGDRGGAPAVRPCLQRTQAATEAMFLMMRRAFQELGYRRYEWKTDSLNARSRAERYGFRFEGIFRQAVVYKGRSRDTAWYSILDSEWPAVQAPERWLDPANFDAQGRQRRRLSDLRR